MQIQHHFSLKNYNTFGLQATANQFVEIEKVLQLKSVLKQNRNNKIFVLGGGSNLLLTKNVEELVVFVNLKGKKIVNQDDNFVWVRAMAGENWHDFVTWSIDQGYGGIENLSLIPGNVGTTPVQNIGAYGIEIKDVLTSCETICIENQEVRIFSNLECEFAYRESIFKNNLKNKYIITAVTFRLTKNNHKINIAYGDIEKELASQNIENPTLKQVSNAVIAIRKSKLPDPKVLGNCGSFFKNPIISRIDFDQIKSKFPEIKYFEVDKNLIKVPAGWLIEYAGFKGKRFENAGIHEKQALVLVNYGGATGEEILNISKNIQQSVFEIFGIKIETEVNIY